jgi:hypothetical protein
MNPPLKCNFDFAARALSYTVFLWKSSVPGPFYADVLTLARAKAIKNAGFRPCGFKMARQRRHRALGGVPLRVIMPGEIWHL